MEYTINELRQRILQQVYEVYDIFKNFFGEEYVDLQDLPTNTELELYLDARGLKSLTGDTYLINDEAFTVILGNFTPNIIVWWPEVTVTNEYDRSVLIKDLFAKIPVTLEGRMPVVSDGFRLTRSTYNQKQWMRGYCHSHIVPFTNKGAAPGFSKPCLGRGPIKQTITSLKTVNDTVTWMTFCQELALYVTVESISGIPYIKMESIDAVNKRKSYAYTGYEGTIPDNGLSRIRSFDDYKERLKSFVSYYLEHGHLTFNYREGHFTCGMPYYDFIIDISNCFISWFNKYGIADRIGQLFEYKILNNVQISDGTFYEPNNLSQIQLSNMNQKILSFKGHDVMLHIEMDTDTSETPTLLISQELAMYILNSILKIVNYHYGNYNESADNTSTATTHQTAYYI